jgi:phage baseplate assembly protein W
MYALKVNPDEKTLRQIDNLIEDIEQSITTILLTPKGTKIFEPEFGSDLLSYIDKLAPQYIPKIVSEVWRVIQRWEPRVNLLKVEVEPAFEDGGYRFAVVLTYEIKTLNTVRTQVVKV